MRRKILPFVMLFSAMCLFASCLSSDDDEVTYYDDTAVASFSLGTLKRVVHATSSTGADSTYTTTLNCSGYRFYIDQQKGEIYNPDSLPLGVDASKAVCTVTSKRNGVIVLKDVDSDTLTFYSSTDSIDFSVPRELRVYNTSGNGSNANGGTFRAYTVRVNVHQEAADSFRWVRQAEVPAGVGILLSQRETLLAQQEWTREPLDDAADLLPTKDVSLVTLPLQTNPGNMQVLVGNRSVTDFAADATAVVWGRVVESDAEAASQPWLYYPQTVDNTHLLPRMSGLRVVAYDNALLAVGGKGEGACAVEAFSGFYKSLDKGITWHVDNTFQLPADFDTSTEQFELVVDEAQYLWLICTDTNQVWRGRINRLGWATEQTAFRE